MQSSKKEDFSTNCDIEGRIGTEKNIIWKPLLRQCMICCGVWYIYFTQGLHLGAQTVLIAQIRREANSTQAVTDEMSSWLSSSPSISSLPLMFIFPWLFHRLGRKFTHMTVCAISIISEIVFYVSTKIDHVLISQIVLGASVAATNSFAPIIISEYTSPKYRGIFLTLKSVSLFWGIWVANIIGTIFYWKNIAMVSLVCSIYAATVIMWPESPYWLAKKGRYLECAKSHRWLKGVSTDSEKELTQLINSQKRSLYDSAPPGDIDIAWFSGISKIWLTIKKRSFYKPALLCIIVFAQYHFTGKFIIAIYAIEVLKNMTEDESVAYKGMLILDGITIFSMYFGCILSRYFKRRVLMFSFAIIGNVFLYTLSLYLYLISLSSLNENHVIVVFLLSVFSIATGCGPMILASSIYGEIIPANYQTSIMILVGLSALTVMSITLKLSLLMFRVLKMHGCFLFFALSSTFIIIVLYIYLPETKDKTILEISKYFEEPLPEQQNKKLLQKKELG